MRIIRDLAELCDMGQGRTLPVEANGRPVTKLILTESPTFRGSDPRDVARERRVAVLDGYFVRMRERFDDPEDEEIMFEGAGEIDDFFVGDEPEVWEQVAFDLIASSHLHGRGYRWVTVRGEGAWATVRRALDHAQLRVLVGVHVAAATEPDLSLTRIDQRVDGLLELVVARCVMPSSGGGSGGGGGGG